ncbi:MAG TPA: crotonyl-CoA carboxylase/reductase, partial [Acidimicrobiales bacterium]
MHEMLAAVLEGAGAEALVSLPMPETYRAAYVRREDEGIFEGVASADKDPAVSIQVGEVPVPELAPDEAYVAVMASSI